MAEITITESDVQDIVDEVSAAEGIDVADFLKAGFLAGLTVSIQDAANAAFVSYKAALIDGFSPDLGADAVEIAERAADDAARIHARNLATNMTQTELRGVARTIADGLDAGLGRDAIGRRLKAVTGLDRTRAATLRNAIDDWTKAGLKPKQIADRTAALRKKLLADRKKTIATTEARFATEEARFIEADTTGAKWKEWITAGDRRVDPICQDHEAQGPIPLHEAFIHGHMISPAHTRCRCSMAYGTTEARRQRMEEHSAARTAQTAAALEDAA